MYKNMIFLFSISIFMGAGCSLTQDPPRTPGIASFEDCVRAGNAVMESYPRQCRSGDFLFVENIAGENVSASANIPTFNQQHTMIDESLLEQFSHAVLKTNKGDITVEFYGDASPKTVANFFTLAKQGFYDGTTFHRIIPDFMIQGGDPLSKDADKRAMHGTGGPGYKFEDEINSHPLVRGSLAMANSGPNTNGSQFFIVTSEETPWLDGKHTNFGRVVSGMNVIDAIEGVSTDARDNPFEPIVIESIELK